MYCQPSKTDPYYIQPTDTVSPYHPTTIVRHILQDKSGNIWMASWTGIVKYVPEKNGASGIFTNYMLKESLIPFHTFCIKETKKGELWFGTVRGGVYRFDGKSWILYTTENGLADDLIDAFMEDKNGYIWIGTDGGVSIYDPTVPITPGARAGIVTPAGAKITSKKGFANYGEADGLLNLRTNSIIQDKFGKIWVATRGGVFQCDPIVALGDMSALSKVTKEFTQFYIKSGVPFTNVRCIKEDKKGIVWIGGADGLYSYNPELKGDSALKLHMPNFIGYINEDKAGNLWISCGEMHGMMSYGMSLYKYPLAEHRASSKMLTKIYYTEAQVFESTEDKDGNIWFGTVKGPIRYEPEKNGSGGKVFTEFWKK